MILIYVPEITERIKYIFSFIFERILGIPIQITESAPFFFQQKIPKFSYSSRTIENEIHFSPHRLLFESELKNPTLDELLQDPFATSFYLLSRYEEYLPFEADLHQRFSYKSSSIKEKIDLTSPWIDQTAYNIFTRLQQHYPTLKAKERKFKFINTIDIDHAWLYKNKSWDKTGKSLLKKLLNFEWKELVNQINILSNGQPDPYFIYPYIRSLQIPTSYFISYGSGSKWDTNHKPDNLKYQHLIQELDKNELNTLGLHPSYHSNKNPDILKKEKENLENLLQKKVLCSRQHFIKLKLPDTYNCLIDLGIREDFSMGFQDHTGFRAGTCTSFYWFDLLKNKVSDLKIHPFCVMDVSLKNYMNLSVREAEDEVSNLIRSVKNVNGTFISIFHNDSLSGHGEWKTWKSLYEKLISEINDPYILS
jgi:hypothetical protein